MNFALVSLSLLLALQPSPCAHPSVHALLAADNPRALRVLVLGNSRMQCATGLGCAAVRVLDARVGWEADSTGPAGVNPALERYRWDARPGRLHIEELAQSGQGYPLQLTDHWPALQEHLQNKPADLVLMGYAGNQGEAGTDVAAMQILHEVLAVNPAAAVVLFSDVCVPNPAGTEVDGRDGCLNLRRSRRWMASVAALLRAEYGGDFPVVAVDTLGDDDGTPFLPAAMVGLRGTGLLSADGVQWYLNINHPSRAGADAWMRGILASLAATCQ